MVSVFSASWAIRRPASAQQPGIAWGVPRCSRNLLLATVPGLPPATLLSALLLAPPISPQIPGADSLRTFPRILHLSTVTVRCFLPGTRQLDWTRSSIARAVELACCNLFSRRQSLYHYTHYSTITTTTNFAARLVPPAAAIASFLRILQHSENCSRPSSSAPSGVTFEIYRREARPSSAAP